MRSFSGRCPGLWKPLGFQPVVACNSVSFVCSVDPLLLLSLQDVLGYFAYDRRALPWAKEAIGLSARCCL